MGKPIKKFAVAVWLTAAACLIGLGGAGKPPATVQAWLHAFNADDAAALKALGDESAQYDRDKHEETGGLTFVKIDSDDGHTIVATAREKRSPETWRLTFVRDPADPSRFKEVHRYADPMHSMADALAALNDFATRLADKGKFSGTIEIAKAGKPLYAKAFGSMGPGRSANTLDTKFYYGSLGKMFTTVAILQLIDAGKIALDTPIIKYLPDYPNKPVAKEVTVRMLLMMRDGLGGINILVPKYATNRAKVHSLADLIALNAGRKPEFKPGSKFEYNNFGMIVLGAIVQKVSGEDFYDYVHAHVFESPGHDAHLLSRARGDERCRHADDELEQHAAAFVDQGFSLAWHAGRWRRLDGGRPFALLRCARPRQADLQKAAGRGGEAYAQPCRPWLHHGRPRWLQLLGARWLRARSHLDSKLPSADRRQRCLPGQSRPDHLRPAGRELLLPHATAALTPRDPLRSRPCGAFTALFRV